MMILLRTPLMTYRQIQKTTNGHMSLSTILRVLVRLEDIGNVHIQRVN